MNSTNIKTRNEKQEHFVQHNKRRIQDFPYEGAPTFPFKFARFFQKLHEIKKISGARRGRPALHPPLITFTLHICVGSISCRLRVLYNFLLTNFTCQNIYKCIIIDGIKAQRLIKTGLSLEKKKSCNSSQSGVITITTKS